MEDDGKGASLAFLARLESMMVDTNSELGESKRVARVGLAYHFLDMPRPNGIGTVITCLFLSCKANLEPPTELLHQQSPDRTPDPIQQQH